VQKIMAAAGRSSNKCGIDKRRSIFMQVSKTWAEKRIGKASLIHS